MEFKERAYQRKAVDSIYDYFESNEGNPLVLMPTGTGKSFVIAQFIKEVLTAWPNQKFMMLTHVKELIEQNAEKVFDIWPNAPLGIYSAGLNSRDVNLPIIFGGIQSVNKFINKELEIDDPDVPNESKHFGNRDIVIIDEAHLVSEKENSQYIQTLENLKKINPKLKVIGLSAVHYRLKDGCLTNGKIFTDICYNITDMKNFNRLVEDGFLSPLVSKKTTVEIDTTKLKITGDDFNKKQLQNEADKITYEACKEIVQYGLSQNRKSWLIFASGIEHSEHVAEMLQSMGINAVASHSKVPKNLNKEYIQKFKSGEIQALVNMNKYTTGFDHPGIDLIGMLRATISPGLWVQMLGRGTRPCEGKENCLVLDFAGNTMRLGPINDVVKPSRKNGKGTGEAPVKICDNCGSYQHASVRLCSDCGAEFIFKTKLKNKASDLEVMRNNKPIVKWLDVQKVVYSQHNKIGSPPILKVGYFCGSKRFNEFVCFEHKGYAKKIAHDWWIQRNEYEPPPLTWQALDYANNLRQPKQIRVNLNKKYPEILGVRF